MDEHDQYESLGLDDSLEDERDLDQIIADRKAAESELDARDVPLTSRKLPHLLHDQGNPPPLSWPFLLLIRTNLIPFLSSQTPTMIPTALPRGPGLISGLLLP